MPVVLTRIDDRLIHGQITEGWARSLKTDNIVVVSDDIAHSEWETELCLAALPPQIDGTIVSIEESPDIINKLMDNPRNSYVLFETPHDAFSAVEHGARIKEINVGGMHSSKNKHEIIDYIFVDDDDVKALQALHEAGVRLDFRDLPDNNPVNVLSML